MSPPEPRRGRFSGYIFAALAAAFYGTNPIFAVPLYGGMDAVSVLLFRYLLGIPLLAAIIVCRSRRLLPARGEAAPLAVSGIVMGLSSLALYEAYRFMSAGLASTLLFMYPVLTSLLMTLFFHEKFRPVTGVCLALTGAGLCLLMRPAEGADINVTGFALIFLSSLTYAVYLVMMKVSRVLALVPPLRSLLWQLLFGGLVFVVALPASGGFHPPQTLSDWTNLAALAVFPTVLSLLFTLRAIAAIGPTATAIFGALEPVTAVSLALVFLGESISGREIFGGCLIVAATLLVVAGGRERTARPAA
ncbi:MAG: DMT family transporter [Desulfovibrio sp.]|nr:DMT family transporter [Desulfovibrio sp.]